MTTNRSIQCVRTSQERIPTKAKGGLEMIKILVSYIEILNISETAKGGFDIKKAYHDVIVNSEGELESLMYKIKSQPNIYAVGICNLRGF